MTYNEWRDELKNNLLSVSDGERRHVLEYYEEAYADRREAGFSEERIIAEFGAPHDAAQRILSELPPEPQVAPAHDKPIAEGADVAGPDDGFFEAPDEKGDLKKDGTETPPVTVVKARTNGKRALKILAIVFSCIITAALVVFIVGVALNDWQVVTKYEQCEYDCGDGITVLDIDGTVGNINIELYDGDRVHVDYPTSKRFSVTVAEENGKLAVKGPTSYFPFWGYYNIPDTVIRLPKDKIYDLDLNVSAGSMNVADGVYNKCNFNVSAGKLRLGKLQCASAAFTVSAGSVDAKGIVSLSKIKLDISAGDFESDGVVASDIDVDVSAGSVELEILGKEEEYTVSVKKSAGSCNIKERKGTTGKTIDISVSAGSVEIEFEH